MFNPIVEYEIKPRHPLNPGFSELWQNRELLYMFALRDIKVKYKQTYLGIAWALLQPGLMTLLFTLGLGRIINVSTCNGLNYPAFALSGFVLWNLFATGLSNAGNSMVSNAAIIKKIYFPRLVIPVSSFLVAFVDFTIALCIMLPVMLFLGTGPVLAAWLYMPLSILLCFLAAFGLGTFLSAANIKYRDVRYVLPFITQALFFASPVIYPLNLNPQAWYTILIRCNPMYAPLELFRAAFGYNINAMHLWPSIACSLFFVAYGLYYFKKTEHFFADLA